MKRRSICKGGFGRLVSILTAVVVAAASVGAYSVSPAAAKSTNYNNYSNNTIEFGLGLRTDHKRPLCDKPKGIRLSDFKTYYYGPKAYKKKKKVIYLTFDCGYENGNTKYILNTLKRYKVKAIFFVTEPYVKDNPKLVKRMKREGHLVGNHTCSHPRMTSLTVAQMKREVRQCARTMKKKTGYRMDPYFRPPEGVYSVRVMKVMKDMGYSTMLWSLALYDYDVNNQPSVSTVRSMFKAHHFCGMMPLLHVVSSGDRKALPYVIKDMKKKGYRFGTVDEFAGKKAKKKSAKKSKK